MPNQRAHTVKQHLCSDFDLPISTLAELLLHIAAKQEQDFYVQAQLALGVGISELHQCLLDEILIGPNGETRLQALMAADLKRSGKRSSKRDQELDRVQRCGEKQSQSRLITWRTGYFLGILFRLSKRGRFLTSRKNCQNAKHRVKSKQIKRPPMKK